MALALRIVVLALALALALGVVAFVNITGFLKPEGMTFCMSSVHVDMVVITCDHFHSNKLTSIHSGDIEN